MAKYKVVFVEALSSQINPETDLGKLAKKYVSFANYTAGKSDIMNCVEAKKFAPADLATCLESIDSLFVTELSAENFNEGMKAIVEASTRHTFLVVSAQNALVFAGTPANKENKEQVRACTAENIMPTLSYAFGFTMPEDNFAPVLYSAYKDPAFPHTENQKLTETIASLEAAMERESRMPWDKHDCA